MNENLKYSIQETVDLKWTEKIIDGKTSYIPILPRLKSYRYILRKNKEKFVRVGKDYLLITLYKVLKEPKYIVIITKYSNLEIKIGKVEEIFEDIIIPYWIKYQTLDDSNSNLEFVRSLFQANTKIDMQDKTMENLLDSAERMVLGTRRHYINMIMQGLSIAGEGKDNYDWLYHQDGVELKLSDVSNAHIVCKPYLIHKLYKYESKMLRYNCTVDRWKNGITVVLKSNVGEEEFFEKTIFDDVAQRGKSLDAGTSIVIIREDLPVIFGIAGSPAPSWETALKVTTSMQAIITPVIPQRRSKGYYNIESITVDVERECLIYSVLRALYKLHSKRLIPTDEGIDD